MIQQTNYIKNYNDMAYASRLVKFSDFMSNKYNIVHKKLFNMALNKYIKEWLKVKHMLIEIEVIKHEIASSSEFDKIEKLNKKLSKYKYYVNKHKKDKKYIDGKYIYDVNSIEEFKNNCIIFEIKNDEYWKPSICKITTKFRNKLNPNLSWQVDLSPYWNNYQAYTNNEFINTKLSDESFKDAKIVDINYVQGKAKLYSENIDREIEVDFDYINGHNIEVDEELKLKNTFSDLRKK